MDMEEQNTQQAPFREEDDIYQCKRKTTSTETLSNVESVLIMVDGGSSEILGTLEHVWANLYCLFAKLVEYQNRRSRLVNVPDCGALENTMIS